MLKKILLISAISLILLGCASSGYNRPYMLTDSQYSVKEQKRKIHKVNKANRLEGYYSDSEKN